MVKTPLRRSLVTLPVVNDWPICRCAAKPVVTDWKWLTKLFGVLRLDAALLRLLIVQAVVGTTRLAFPVIVRQAQWNGKAASSRSTPQAAPLFLRGEALECCGSTQLCYSSCSCKPWLEPDASRFLSSFAKPSGVGKLRQAAALHRLKPPRRAAKLPAQKAARRKSATANAPAARNQQTGRILWSFSHSGGFYLRYCRNGCWERGRAERLRRARWLSSLGKKEKAI